MTPISSSDNQSLVKPNPPNDRIIQDVEQDCNSDEEDYNISNHATMIGKLVDDYFPNQSFKPDFLKMDGTYDNNILKPLTFTYGTEPNNTCNSQSYNRCHPAIRDNAKNRIKDPLKACIVAGGLNKELLLRLIFNFNKYVQTYSDKDETFCDDDWCNSLFVEVYHFLGIILIMSLIFSNADGFRSHWHPPTQVSLSPSYQFDIRGYPLWIKYHVSFQYLSRFVLHFIPKTE